jgi:hypothetical protein
MHGAMNGWKFLDDMVESLVFLAIMLAFFTSFWESVGDWISRDRRTNNKVDGSD